MKKNVILSILSNLPGNLCRVKFLAVDGYGTILKSFTCNPSETKEMIEAYCQQYNFNII